MKHSGRQLLAFLNMMNLELAMNDMPGFGFRDLSFFVEAASAGEGGAVRTFTCSYP